MKNEKCGAQVLVIKEIYVGKDEKGKDDKKGKVRKPNKGKEKEVETEDSMSSFSFRNAKDMRTKTGEKV